MRRLVSFLLLALVACEAPPAGRSVLELRGPAWVGDAAAGWDARTEPFIVRATGRARLAEHPRGAELAAEAVARESLRGFLDEVVARLGQVFRERNAGLISEASLQAATGDGAARASLVSAALARARLQGQWSDDESFFAWLALDAGQHLLPAVEGDLSTRLAAQSRELTAGDRTALADELAALIAARQGR